MSARRHVEVGHEEHQLAAPGDQRRRVDEAATAAARRLERPQATQHFDLGTARAGGEEHEFRLHDGVAADQPERIAGAPDCSRERRAEVGGEGHLIGVAAETHRRRDVDENVDGHCRLLLEAAHVQPIERIAGADPQIDAARIGAAQQRYEIAEEAARSLQLAAMRADANVRASPRQPIGNVRGRVAAHGAGTRSKSWLQSSRTIGSRRSS